MNDKIIGGEYLIDGLTDLSSENADNYLFSCGRTALIAILKHVFSDCQGEVLVPDYICESVPETIRKMGHKCRFYHIMDNFLPSLDSIFDSLGTVKALILVNYFGMIPRSVIDSIIESVKNERSDILIIIDDVQNYYGFFEETKCDYVFTSFRKWFPVPDGARVIFNDGVGRKYLVPSDFVSEVYISGYSKYKFAGNILKNFRGIIGDEICLELIEKGECMIRKESISSAIPWTHGVMEKIDYQLFKSKRQKNAKYLHDGLNDLGIPHLYSDDAIPLFVPVILKCNRDGVRSAMFRQYVFCPIHWSEGWKKDYYDVEKNDLSDWELSLICDHRYGEEEMQYQLEILKNECSHI